MNDLISRQEAIRLYCREHCGCEPEECGCTLERDGAEDCSYIRFLKELPSVQPEQKRGKWTEKYIDDAEPFLRRRFYCSACGEWQTYGETDYCPNCGARMNMKGE